MDTNNRWPQKKLNNLWSSLRGSTYLWGTTINHDARGYTDQVHEMLMISLGIPYLMVIMTIRL